MCFQIFTIACKWSTERVRLILYNIKTKHTQNLIGKLCVRTFGHSLLKGIAVQNPNREKTTTTKIVFDADDYFFRRLLDRQWISFWFHSRCVCARECFFFAVG